MLTYPPSKISEIVKSHTKALEKGLKSQMKTMEIEIIEAMNKLLQEQSIEEDKINPIVAISHIESEREYDEDILEKAEPPHKDEESIKTNFGEAINKKDGKEKKKKKTKRMEKSNKKVKKQKKKSKKKIKKKGKNRKISKKNKKKNK